MAKKQKNNENKTKQTVSRLRRNAKWNAFFFFVTMNKSREETEREQKKKPQQIE